MKIWEKFKEHLKEKFYGGNIFVCKGKLPETKDEIYWYNKALQDCVMDMELYESICESKYKSLLTCLSKKGIQVTYDEMTNKHMININHITIEP
jgi:hypothetical protein